MRLFNSIMIASVAVFAIGGVASAAPRVADMTDSTYLAVARCAGMAEGVGADAAPFNAALETQSQIRTPDVVDRADEAKTAAKRNAAHEGSDGKATIGQQLNGACKGYISAS